jgi:2-desacetyl-2-hydroxyethyl bacteriochlorophyllide A dehydrogenase
MKALVYTGTQQSEIRHVELQSPTSGQAIIDVALCGICGSDMHAWHGHDERRVPPLVLGHEAVGTAIDGKFAGKRVAVNPLMTCGACGFCESGNEHLCVSRELIGMRVSGAFAERLVINEKNLSVIPDHLALHDAALAEPLACAVHAVRLGTELAGENRDAEVVVLGGGAIGLLSALVFAAYGYSRIRVAETNPLRRSMLEKAGAMHAYDPLVGDRNKGSPKAGSVDIVLDAVGSGVTRQASSILVRPGGVIIHIGLQDNEVGLDTRRLTLQEIIFRGTYCYRRNDFAEALRLLADGIIRGAGWAEIRALDDGPAAFVDIHEGKAPAKIILKTST